MRTHLKKLRSIICHRDHRIITFSFTRWWEMEGWVYFSG